MKRLIVFTAIALVILVLLGGVSLPAANAAVVAQGSPTTMPTPAGAPPAANTFDVSDDFWLKPYTPKKQYTMGVSYQNLAFPYVAALQKAMENRPQALGVKLIETDAQNDTNKELANVENILSQKPNLLLFEAASLDASVASIQAANSANIPVVQFNGEANGGTFVSFVGSDQSQSGQLLGQWLLSLMSSSNKSSMNCIYLRGVPGQVTDVARHDALVKVLTDAGKNNAITFTEQYAQYDRGTGQSVTESIVSKSKNYDCLVSNNDDMMLGALTAMKQAGLKIPMCGVDGLPETIADIKAGDITCTVFQNPEGQAAGALTVAAAYLDGLQVPKNVLIPFQLVTSANVDAISQIVNRVYGSAAGTTQQATPTANGTPTP